MANVRPLATAAALSVPHAPCLPATLENRSVLVECRQRAHCTGEVVVGPTYYPACDRATGLAPLLASRPATAAWPFRASAFVASSHAATGQSWPFAFQKSPSTLSSGRYRG